MKKLAVITTHPIQYNAPLFRLISERRNIEIKVFYTWEQSKEKVYDVKFGQEIKWDIPLLEGYDYAFVKNTSRYPNSLSFNGIINPGLNREIETWGADAVLVYGWNHHSHLKAMRYFKGKIPVYFRGDSTIIDYVSWIRKLIKKIILNQVYKNTDIAFYVGQNNKAYFLHSGLTESQLVFAPHAVDNFRFSNCNNQYSKKVSELRRLLGFSENDRIFLFAGKFETIKNPLILIEAAKYFPQYKFLFAGNGILESKMKTLSAKISNITYLPFQNQTAMPAIYHLSHVAVLPSQGHGETWGLVVNEAMACGKAVLVSDKVGCAVDLVESGKNGYIFCSNDLEDLKEKIESFENKFDIFGKYSSEKIKNWSFEKIAEAFEKALNSKITL
jgi:glycosyltransferase involved in cell wall biosynthesis